MVTSIDGHVMRVVARFDHRRAAVVVDEEIVVVAGQDEIDRVRVAISSIVLPAVGMHDRDDEIGAFATQRLAPAP